MEIGTTQPGKTATTPSPPSDGGEGRGEEARLFWIAPLLGPLPARSSRGEEEKACHQIFVVNARTCIIVVQRATPPRCRANSFGPPHYRPFAHISQMRRPGRLS